MVEHLYCRQLEERCTLMSEALMNANVIIGNSVLNRDVPLLVPSPIDSSGVRWVG